MKIYERELPQKQYHWATSGYFHVPRNHKPSPGDRYIGRWATWLIGRISLQSEWKKAGQEIPALFLYSNHPAVSILECDFQLLR